MWVQRFRGSGFKGSGFWVLGSRVLGSKVQGSGFRVQRLYPHHYALFCKLFVWENRPLSHSHKSGKWYLAIIWQNQHFLRGLRIFNFVLVPNPEL
jgi:hypothetical protein